MRFYVVWNHRTQDFIRKGSPVYIQGDYKGRGGVRVYTERRYALSAANQINNLNDGELEIRHYYNEEYTIVG